LPAVWFGSFVGKPVKNVGKNAASANGAKFGTWHQMMLERGVSFALPIVPSNHAQSWFTVNGTQHICEFHQEDQCNSP
jgi:hypothetical protein